MANKRDCWRDSGVSSAPLFLKSSSFSHPGQDNEDKGEELAPLEPLHKGGIVQRFFFFFFSLQEVGRDVEVSRVTKRARPP